MPLPNSTAQPWPPRQLAPVTDKLSTWSAWYAGDPDQLSAIYGGQIDTTGNEFFQSEAGGFVAKARQTIARWFWGTMTPQREQRSKLHVPLASDIASTSAKLLYAEPPKLTVTDQATQKRLDDLADDGMHATLLQAGEVRAALGGVYQRVCWDTDISDRPFLAAVHADAAVPEWRWDRLTAVTFWRVIAIDAGKVYRHLERHEPGVILHGVYEGTRDTLGVAVDLAGFPDTATLTAEIQTSLPGKRITATYVPNMRPNRIWRSNPTAAPLGRSDYQGAEPLMDALDETYTSWMRDIRLGKARLIVADSMLRSEGRGKGATFETEREVYEALNILQQPGGGKAEITPNQFAIRFAEHQATAQHFLEQILRSAGYSVQTVGESREGEATATEIRARERLSFTTRDLKIVYCRPPEREIVETLLLVDRYTLGTRGIVPELPGMEFGDSVSEDPRQLAETVELLHRAQSASTEVRVRMVHPDWEDDKVDQEVQAIMDEHAMNVPDPTSFPGNPAPAPAPAAA